MNIEQWITFFILIMLTFSLEDAANSPIFRELSDCFILKPLQEADIQ